MSTFKRVKVQCQDCNHDTQLSKLPATRLAGRGAGGGAAETGRNSKKKSSMANFNFQLELVVTWLSRLHA